MALSELAAPPDGPAPPPEVRRFLREADRRIEAFRRDCRVPAFVPSDYVAAYNALLGLESSALLRGRWFCEWGSGFGVTACLAALVGLDAWGIEVEQELVDAARLLAEDFDVPARFVCGSFIPAGDDVSAAAAGDCSWMASTAGAGHEGLGMETKDFDLVFAYPWPDEERLTAALFDRHARDGALLLTYHEAGGLRLRRKAGGRRGRRV